jgi:hypothetical protein
VSEYSSITVTAVVLLIAIATANPHLQLLQQHQLLCSAPSSTGCWCCCSTFAAAVHPQQLQSLAALQQQLVLCLQPIMLSFQPPGKKFLGGKLQQGPVVALSVVRYLLQSCITCKNPRS